MTLLTATCRYGDEIIVSPRYIEYRNRLIDWTGITEISVRGKKFLINSFKQNTTLPTMCIHMASHDEALHLYQEVEFALYHEPLPTHKKSRRGCWLFDLDLMEDE